MSISFSYSPTTTTSQSFDFNLTRNQIIEIAYENVGVKGQNQTLTAEQYTRATQILNLIVKNWASDNVYIWNINWDVLSLVDSSVVLEGGKDYQCIKNHVSSLRTQPGIGTEWKSFWTELSTTAGSAWVIDTQYVSKSNYELPTNLINIENVRIKQGETYSPLETMSREEYFRLGDPLSEGRPTRYYYERGRVSELYLYPAPDDVTDYSLEMYCYKYPEDFDIGSNNGDFLQEWIEPLTLALAVKLAPQHGIFGTQLQNLKDLADEAVDKARSSDHEFGDIFIKPNIRGI